MALIGQAVSEKEMFEIMVIYMYIALGHGAETPLGLFFKIINLLSVWSFAASFPLND